MSLNIAAGFGLGGNVSYPDVFAPFGGFANSTAVVNSMVGFHRRPGVDNRAARPSTPRAASLERR